MTFTPPLFAVTEGRIALDDFWFLSKDADCDARDLFDRHYSRIRYADGRSRKHFVGPGEKLVMISRDATSLFVWRKFIDASGQQGVNCAVFRNESSHLSSLLILKAEQIAWHRWPTQRLYTYVNSKAVRSTNPGYCFQVAGWNKCGITKWNKLVILEKFPMRHENGNPPR